MASTSRLPDPIQESYEWQHRGACRGVDPETFFSPETERGPRRRSRRLASQFCKTISQSNIEDYHSKYGKTQSIKKNSWFRNLFF